MADTARKTVALLVETSNDYARGLLHGIVAYVREHRPWSTYLAEHGRGDAPPTWLSDWKGDGIIARVENARIAKAVAAVGLPLVDLSAANLVPGVPWVETDDRLIARAAFEHLAGRGFKHFAFCGDDHYNWSRWRGEAFCAAAKRQGSEPHVLSRITAGPRSREGWGAEMERLARWVEKLPKPIGIMACFDLVGRQVLEACRLAGAAVPDEVAVVGVDNDELLCELADPPLSSVAPDTHRTGYLAASLLDQLMSGRSVRPGGHFMEPLGVVVRTSSDVLAIEDADVSAAVRYIRRHACEGINVNDVLAQAPLSRRVLEARFKKLIGRTPHEEIERVRLDRVKELLRETDLPLSEVARRAGYEHVEYLSVVFKKRVGSPPSEYRRVHRR
jgi:LacI family transcriptional regulator